MKVGTRFTVHLGALRAGRRHRKLGAGLLEEAAYQGLIKQVGHEQCGRQRLRLWEKLR